MFPLYKHDMKVVISSCIETNVSKGTQTLLMMPHGAIHGQKINPTAHCISNI